MAYNFLQALDGYFNGAGTTVTKAITYAGGETSLVIASFNSASAVSCTVSDGVNTYTQVGGYHLVGTDLVGLFQASNVAAGSVTVTVTTNVSSSRRGVVIATYSGLSNVPGYSLVYNEQATPTTGVDAVTSTVTTPTSQPAMIFGFSLDNTGTAAINVGTANSPTGRNTFASWNASVGYFGRVQDFRITTTTAVASTFTATSASSHTDTFAAVFSEAQISPLQETQSIGGSGASIATAFTSNVTAGSSIHVVVRGIGASSYTVSDNLNGAYTQRGLTLNDGGSGHVEAQFTKDGSIAGAVTITVTPNVSATFVNVWAREIGFTSGFDVHAEQVQSGLSSTATDAISTGVASPGNQPGLISAFTNSTTGGSALPLTPGTGFTFVNNPWGASTSSEWLRYSDFSPRAGTWTASSVSSTTFMSFAAFFKQTGSSAGGGVFTLAANTGIYAVAANAATLTSSSGSFTLPLATATYAVTGIDSTLVLQGSFTLLAAPASYDVVGGLGFSDFSLDAATATYNLSGQIVSFSLNGGASFSLSLAGTTYSYVANAVNLTQSLQFTLIASGAVYTLAGIDSSFAIGGGGVTPAPSPTAILNLEIVSDAFQKVGIIDETQAPSAEQGANGLKILNDYLLWQARDSMKIGWYTQTDLSAVAPLRSEDVWAVKMLLAGQLAIAYGITITDMGLAKSIQDAERTLTKRTLRYMESDLGELSRAQGSAFGGPGWN